MLDSETPKIAYSPTQAATAIGLSIDVVRRAIWAGDLEAVAPIVNGRTLTRRVIMCAELERWIRSGGAA